MTDSLLLWAFNVLFQVTCVSGLGLAVAMLVKRHAPAKCWVLNSALVLMLFSLFTAAVMQGLGHSLISVDVFDRMAGNEESHGQPLSAVRSQPQNVETRSTSAHARDDAELATVADSTLEDELQAARPRETAPPFAGGRFGSV